MSLVSLLVVVGLVAHRVPAGILVEIDVARLPAIRSQMPAEARWWRSSVVRMKSSFEQFIRSTMAWKRGTLRSTSSRGVSFSRAAVCCIFMAVLVGAGEEEDVVAVEPHEAGDRVGRDRLVGVTDMRRRRSDRRSPW